MGISHYKASWVGGEDWPEPTWPGVLQHGEAWDRKRLQEHYRPWADLARQGVGVHCGEGGAFAHGIGYALWNFRGPFGILDSGRQDVRYEDWHGHALDRRLLSLLQQF